MFHIDRTGRLRSALRGLGRFIYIGLYELGVAMGPGIDTGPGAYDPNRQLWLERDPRLDPELAGVRIASVHAIGPQALQRRSRVAPSPDPIVETPSPVTEA